MAELKKFDRTKGEFREEFQNGKVWIVRAVEPDGKHVWYSRLYLLEDGTLRTMATTKRKLITGLPASFRMEVNDLIFVSPDGVFSIQRRKPE